MMVAWHEMPGKRRQKRIRPVGHGMIDLPLVIRIPALVRISSLFRKVMCRVAIRLDESNRTVPTARIPGWDIFQAFHARLPSSSPSGTMRIADA